MRTSWGWSTTRGIAAALAIVLAPAEVSLAVMLVADTPAPVLAKDARDAKAPPALDGVWKLNETQSESLQKKMAELRGSGGGGGAGGEGGGRMGGRHGGGGGGNWGGRGGGGEMGGGGEGGRGGRGPGAGNGESADAAGTPGGGAARTNLFSRPPMMMAVEQTDTALVISERGDLVATLFLDPTHKVAEPAARQPGQPGPPPGPAELSAKWKGERLEAEGTGPRGAKLHQSYELSKDGKQLIVVTRMEGTGNRPAIELKRVYDKYEGD